MILIDRIEITDIPVLTVVQQSLVDEALPTVIYYHGFNGEKESSLTIAYKMAEKGIRVILPDAPLHGERAVSDEPIEHGHTFWTIVTEAIEEIETIKIFLQSESVILDDRIGLAGTSMGGMLTYGALRTYDWIKTAAVLMGTPYLTNRAKTTMAMTSQKEEDMLQQVEEIDLTTSLPTLQQRPLFIWHGEKDDIVPVSDSRKFYEVLQKEYTNEEDLQFIEEKERIHNISKLSIRKTAEWFHAKL